MNQALNPDGERQRWPEPGHTRCPLHPPSLHRRAWGVGEQSWCRAAWTTASCITGPFSGGYPTSSGLHDSTFPPPPWGKAGAPCSGPLAWPQPPLAFLAVLGLLSTSFFFLKLLGEGPPPCMPWRCPWLGVILRRVEKHSSVESTVVSGLRWSLVKSVQTLPLKLCLHPRPVATGRQGER